MLILKQNLSASIRRPKYRPRSKHAEWAVLVTGSKRPARRVFGTGTLAVCAGYMDKAVKLLGY